MPFITVSDEVAKKSFTQVENKFITKYLPVLEPLSVKVYLYSLYIYQCGNVHYTIDDMAQTLGLTSDDVKNYFEYLEELELVSVTSLSPFEIKILDAENVYGTPKKFKPEKYSDFTKSVQNIIKGRMISTNEFREYFCLLEDYGFEQNALLMIINYCVNLKGDDIKAAYIKKVAKSFADEGVTTAKKVDQKLAAYTSSTPALIRLFTAAGIKKQPDIDDDRLYKKWTGELGFDENAVIAVAKQFKAKNCEKLDNALLELYKNRKFDVKEIEDYCKNKNSVYSLTIEIAKSLGVYMQDSTPYVENYVNVWCNYGYSFESIKTLANYCFRHGKNSFEDMDGLLQKMYDDGTVDEYSVTAYIEKQSADDRLLKELLTACGLTRKVIDWDRESLKRWRGWNFDDKMLSEAAKISAGKSNPLAYMNGILSSWKNEGVYSPDKITSKAPPASPDRTATKAEIERHYYDLRHAAEAKAEKALNTATADEIYGNIRKQLNELSIQIAFAEVEGGNKSVELEKQIYELDLKADERLKELCIDKADFTPNYSCKKCNDTGYLPDGTTCDCLKKFISTLKI